MVSSDHFLILLSGIEKMWLKIEGSRERVRDWWTSYDFRGSPNYVLDKKLKSLKRDIKRGI